MPIIALLPSLFTLISTVFGAVTNDHKASIISSILGGAFDGSSGSLINIIQNVMGSINDAKKLELQAHIDTLLASSEIAKQDAASDNWLKYGWRLMIAWGLGLNLVIHYSFINIQDILNSFMLDKPIPPMDNMALIIITGLLGLYIGARTYEKTR